MRFSLLYADGISAASDAVSQVALRELLADTFVAAFEPNAPRVANFLRVLAHSTDRESARFRQDILRDFIVSPKLLRDLREMFKSYDDMRGDWQQLRSALGVYKSLKATADFISQTINYFNAFSAALGEYDLNSAGLNGLKSWLRELVSGDALSELREIASMFDRDDMNAYTWHIAADFDDTLRIVSASVIGIDEYNEQTRLQKLFSRKRDDDGSIDLQEMFSDTTRRLTSAALFELYGGLTDTADALYDIFHGLSDETDFYITALSYCDYLDGYVFPELASAASEFAGLYDPLLLVEGLSRTAITAHEFTLRHNVLVRGANAAGKTSFLRAVGLAHIFGAAGLPVCASAARLAEFRAVLTQFSKAEELQLNEAGRFEQEVREMSEIVKSCHTALVLLNETFQTTSYAEGAGAIAAILAHMSRLGARYVFVTHLTPLLAAPPSGCMTLVMENYILSCE